MRRILFILLLLPLAAHGIALSWYGSEETKISGQTCWAESANPPGCSTIISACANTTNISFVVVTNSVNPTIPPGNYKLWYKCNPFPQTYGQAYVTAYGGGDPITTAISNPTTDTSSVWKYLGVLNVPFVTNKLAFALSRTNGVHPWPHNAYAVYANTDTNVTLIGSSEAVQQWIVPTTTNTSAVIPGNIMPNSSFELPPPSGPWSLGANASRYTPFYDALSTNDPYNGKTCIRLDFSRAEGNYTGSHIVQSRPVRLRPNRAHSFSIWAKASTNGATIRIALVNPVPYPTGETFPTQPIYQTAALALTTSWAQYKLEGQVLWEYPYCEYYPSLTCTSINGGQIYLDAAQLEEGATATTYNNTPFTIGFDIPQLASLLYPSEVGQVAAIIHNASGTNKTTTVNWNLYYRGYELVKTGAVTVATVNGSFYTNSLALTNLYPGFYRLTSFLQGEEQIQSESDFTVCNVPPTLGLSASNSVIGYHGYHYHHSQQADLRAGLKNWRSLSPGAFFRFSAAHPTTNTYVWFDDKIAAIQQYGVEVFGNLQQEFNASWINRAFITVGSVTGTFQVGETISVSTGATGRITWISQPEDPFPFKSMQLMSNTGTFPVGGTITGNTSGATCTLVPGVDGTGGQLTSAFVAQTFAFDQWRPYCSNIVAHYTNVTTWEMLNEPGAGFPMISGDGGQRAAAMMTRDGVRGVRDVRATDTICILGGSQGPQYADILWNNLPTETRTNVQAASWHLYVSTIDGRGLESVQWCKDRNLESWNTETGYEDGISMLNVSDTRHYNGFALQPYVDSERDILKFARTPRMIATNIIETVWPGMSRYYYYDMRHSATAASDIYSQAGSHYSTLQIHDSFKSKMPPIIFQNAILERYNTKGLALSNSIARVFSMQRTDGTPWLAFYSPRTTNVNMSWSLNSAQYELYNMEGALLPPVNFNVAFGSAPTLVKGIGGTTMATMISALGVATFSTVPDTTAPVLLFKQCPIGNIDQRRNEAGFVVSVVGYDQVSTPWSGNTHSLKYRYKFDSSAWTLWIETSLLAPGTFDGVLRHSEREDTVRFVPGPHTLYVECMDEAGNVGTNQRSFTIL